MRGKVFVPRCAEPLISQALPGHEDFAPATQRRQRGRTRKPPASCFIATHGPNEDIALVKASRSPEATRPSESRGRPAVFLDRDGTVIEHVHYLSDPRDVRLLPGAAAAIRRLRAAGVACSAVTNQPAIR